MIRSDLQAVAAKLPLSGSTLRRNQDLGAADGGLETGAAGGQRKIKTGSGAASSLAGCGVSRAILNKTEQRYRNKLVQTCYGRIFEQAITLRLDAPFKSYRPDLAYQKGGSLVFVEVKAPHRFREKGIAKAALAAKTYPQFHFELAEWNGKEWKESVLSP